MTTVWWSCVRWKEWQRGFSTTRTAHGNSYTASGGWVMWPSTRSCDLQPGHVISHVTFNQVMWLVMWPSTKSCDQSWSPFLLLWLINRAGRINRLIDRIFLIIDYKFAISVMLITSWIHIFDTIFNHTTAKKGVPVVIKWEEFWALIDLTGLITHRFWSIIKTGDNQFQNLSRFPADLSLEKICSIFCTYQYLVQQIIPQEWPLT